MKREFLENIDLGDGAKLSKEAIDSIMAENGKDIEKHKTDAETQKKTAEQAQTQLTEANKTIEGFKAMNIEEIKKSADEWKKKAEDAEKNSETELAKLRTEHALDSALRDGKAKNPKLVKAALDMEKIKLDGDKLLGLSDQIEALKTSDPYLFDEAERDDDPEDDKSTNIRLNSGGGHKSAKTPDYSKMSDDEYYSSVVFKKKE